MILQLDQIGSVLNVPGRTSVHHSIRIEGQSHPLPTRGWQEILLLITTLCIKRGLKAPWHFNSQVVVSPDSTGLGDRPKQIGAYWVSTNRSGLNIVEICLKMCSDFGIAASDVLIEFTPRDKQ
jgi:hypothetical protein